MHDVTLFGDTQYIKEEKVEPVEGRTCVLTQPSLSRIEIFVFPNSVGYSCRNAANNPKRYLKNVVKPIQNDYSRVSCGQIWLVNKGSKAQAI